MDNHEGESKKEPIIQQMVEAPAIGLEKTIEVSQDLKQKIADKPIEKIKSYWHSLGPGLTTGASDDDPSGIATYSQTGAAYGFGYLWLAAFTFPLMAVVQEMCARIGIVTGRGLAGNIRINFSRRILIFCTLLLFVANTLNIGADLGAMAEAVRLFYNINYLVLVVLFGVFIVCLQIFSTYKKYANILKWLSLILLCYIFSALMIDGLNWREIGLRAISPSFEFNKDSIILICAILGTTISPYLFFWQTSQEVEERIERGLTNIKLRQNDASDHEIKEMRVDIWSGMFLSNVVMFFIIVACGATLNLNGITNIDTAAQAAEALRPFAGDYSFFLFALGIIGMGLLGIPVLGGSSSYALAESFGWRQGLHFRLKQAYAFYGVIIISILIGISLNFIGIDPIKALIYSAVANGMVAPVILIFIVLISSSSKVMGEKRSRIAAKVLGWLTVLLMSAAGIAAVWALLF